ncbi:hypothetical protein GPECTOR_64g113 [Gonium pectorale]|uniref:Uncharacterized protein n=1 Tax=Gonium pectorale TaxID=33097 RepID=A0A150G404_GONPE|nr:hypothetical protein GPECTOR_64g113 [Gonium pectorale]|eukprot:KXZ44619.1 hypothetical protein GPECTOR_64g113 [Gonium pectorale]
MVVLSAAESATAAAQVEWLLAAVRGVALQLAAPGGGGGGLAAAQQRALAAQLLSSLRAVAPYDLRLQQLQVRVKGWARRRGPSALVPALYWSAPRPYPVSLPGT